MQKVRKTRPINITHTSIRKIRQNTIPRLFRSECGSDVKDITDVNDYHAVMGGRTWRPPLSCWKWKGIVTPVGMGRYSELYALGELGFCDGWVVHEEKVAGTIAFGGVGGCEIIYGELQCDSNEYKELFSEAVHRFIREAICSRAKSEPGGFGAEILATMSAPGWSRSVCVISVTKTSWLSHDSSGTACSQPSALDSPESDLLSLWTSPRVISFNLWDAQDKDWHHVAVYGDQCRAYIISRVAVAEKNNEKARAIGAELK
ncbi:hypothetical protein E6O75_ATG06828 [Venturia nashicola]|uniref:Uncharacterized protein n=1 Tax=Venturia nashicola TaxID=86259 RepID=A0A4Z1NTJ0_9PEZI|nr:hypothetical protein E6O75_ATG06828 [Venturia nashicola]